MAAGAAGTPRLRGLFAGFRGVSEPLGAGAGPGAPAGADEAPGEPSVASGVLVVFSDIGFVTSRDLSLNSHLNLNT